METLDDSALDKLRKLGGEKLVARMIDLFSSNGGQRVAAARAALQSADFPTAERAVHSLKSSAANVGAAALREMAQRAEDCAAARDEQGLARMLDPLEAELTRVCALLEERRSPRV
jgi:HPt (histidine-containing phosphotransfer) domain-containing protein